MENKIIQNGHPIYKFLIEKRKVAGVWPAMVVIEFAYIYLIFMFYLPIPLLLIVIPLHIIAVIMCSKDYFILPNFITILQTTGTLEP